MIATTGATTPHPQSGAAGGPSTVGCGGLFTVRVRRFTLIDTAEDRAQWVYRAKRQWGGTRPVSVRIYSNSILRGSTRPVRIEYDSKDRGAQPGWANATWGDEEEAALTTTTTGAAASSSQGGADGPAGLGRVPLADDPMLLAEVVSVSGRGAGGHHPPKVLGIGMINAQAMLAEGRQYSKFCVHVLPTHVAMDSGTVHSLLELEIRSGLLTEVPENNFSPLEYNYGSVRVSTLDFYFPSYLLTSSGQYIVSNVICAMNMTESSSLAIQLLPLKGATNYVVAEPAQVITVRPQQRVYFSSTWILRKPACMRTLEMQLTVNGSEQPSAPIIIKVHNSAPQPSTSSTDLPYQYWTNTTCATNRQMLASQELPLIRAILPVFRFMGSGPVGQTEGMIVAFDKDKGEQVLVRANGAPVAMGGPQNGGGILGGGGGGYTALATGAAGLEMAHGISALEMLSSHNSALGSGAELPRQLQDLFPSDFGLTSNASFVVRDRTAPSAAMSSRGPLLNLSQRTCLCTIVLGTIRGLPMVYESATGVSPSFQVSITLLDPQGWQVIYGETLPSYQSASGSLRWSEQLVLRKWPGASSTQFVRLNLTEVRARDGDETPIGAGLVSIASMQRTHAFNPMSVAFYVYETYSLYDQLNSPSLLMKDVNVIFSETR